ncbi:MAG: sigma-70 family RNA polymerase sigma factor, partial [Bacteroidales bacterium]|nr:sigma-70 family RNA polymerase sigma factor [Bacteroidales bacterium]
TGKALRDYELVKAALEKGEQNAYAELMKNYRDSLFFMMLKMTNNPEDADDLTIEAFGKAFKNLRQYTPDYAFSTWLFKIASNNCIDFIRKRRLNEPVSVNLIDLADHGDDLADMLPATSRTPEEDIIRQQKIQALRNIIDRLKPHYKKLIELRYYEERSYEEISTELNLPIGTVKAQLFRAREFLYHILKNRHEKFNED